MSDNYMCPFCVTPWKCNGPHIDQQDRPEFDAYIRAAENRVTENVANAVAVAFLHGHDTGYKQAQEDAVRAIEELPCRCNDGFDYCDGHGDAINTVERLPE